MSADQISCREAISVTRHLDRWRHATDVPSWWGPLWEAASDSSIFLSEDWLRSWLEVYGRDFDGYWVHWRHGGAVVGGCLLVSRVVWLKFIPLRTFFVNATGDARERTPTAEYNDILCLAGFESEVSEDLANLTMELRWHRLMVSGYQDGLLSGLVDRFPARSVESRSSPAAFVDLATIADQPYEQTLTGKVGSHIRRNRRLYEKRFGELAITEATTLDEAMDYFSRLSELHNNRWRKRGHAGSFSSAAVVEFHRRLIARLWPTKQVSMVRVGCDRHAFGYLYNYVLQGKVLVFQTGFRYDEDSSLSPGLLTHTLAIEHYRRQGMREYDLLAGDALYKRSLAKDKRDLKWTIVYRDRLLVRSYLFARKLRDALSGKQKSDA